MPAKASSKEVPLTAALQARHDALFARSADDVSVDEWRELGNDCVGNGSFLTAIRCYTRGLQRDGGDTAVLRSNRSAAYVQSSMLTGPTLALQDAERAVALAPTWYKAYVRVGDAQRARHKLDEAAAAYTHALTLEPTCTTAATALRELKTELYLRELDKQEQQRQRDEAAAAARDDDDDKDNYRTRHDDNGNDANDAYSRSYKSGSTTATTTTATTATRAQPQHEQAEHGSGGHYEFHNAPLDSEEALMRRRRGVPSTDETAELIATWSQDTFVRTDHTAMKPRTVTLDEAARGVGQAYKETLMRSFRSKLSSDSALSARVQESSTRQQLRGEHVDYRKGDELRTQYAHATNAIGLGITTDAYKDYVGCQRKW